MTSDCIPHQVLEHRELTKLVTTFLEPYADRAIGAEPVATGTPTPSTAPSSLMRLHCQWQQTSTGTGRLSSRHPNVQVSITLDDP
jgi:DNA polymerase I-like protein with 3'-5' exonuclease and polymerase domains